jgi:DNA-binding response OmpR family regulator
VVEDELNVGALIQAYLRRDGFEVQWVMSGEEALIALAQPAALIVLDVRLPGIDGLEVCRRVGGRVPVVMLTARADAVDRIAGLEAGADDYLAKPFVLRELVARIKAVLRRTRDRGQDPVAELHCGALTMSPERRQVALAGRELQLTPKEFDLLRYLLERAGRVATREELLREVWGFIELGRTRTVDLHVAQLRMKLGDPGLIQTVQRLGYRLVDS